MRRSTATQCHTCSQHHISFRALVQKFSAVLSRLALLQPAFCRSPAACRKRHSPRRTSNCAEQHLADIDSKRLKNRNWHATADESSGGKGVRS